MRKSLVEIVEVLVVLLFDVGVQLHCGSFRWGGSLGGLGRPVCCVHDASRSARAMTAVECTAEWRGSDANKSGALDFSILLDNTPIYSKIVRTRMKTKGLIFALVQKGARVRKRLKIEVVRLA